MSKAKRGPRSPRSTPAARLAPWNPTGRSAADAEYGRIVSEGRAARQAADKGRWQIGSLALLVEKRYGGRSLERFAEDIGEQAATVRRYRWVAKRYGPMVRSRFPGLSFSHFQAVAGLDDRLVWLERAEGGCWSVDRLVRETRKRGSGRSRPTSAALPAERSALRAATGSLERLSSLDDDSLVAAEAWLVPALDELGELVDGLRRRVRRAGSGGAVVVTGYRVGRAAGNGARGNGNGQNGTGGRNGNGRNGSANGHRKAARVRG